MNLFKPPRNLPMFLSAIALLSVSSLALVLWGKIKPDIVKISTATAQI